MIAGLPPQPGQSRAAIALYTLAVMGVYLAFMPVLVLLIPRRIESFAPENAAVLLSWVLLAGAVMAAAAHILAGHISDRWLARHGNRRGLAALGAGMLGASYLLLAFANSFAAMLAAILAFQLALNFAFAPLGALLTDHFPDRQKGRVSGLMNAALPASNLAVVAVGIGFAQDNAAAFLVTGAVAVACILPLLIFWPLGALHLPAQSVETLVTAPPEVSASRLRDFRIAWCARLAVQLGAAFVQGYIYLYLIETLAAQAADPAARASQMLAGLAAPAALLAILATQVAGYLSDRLAQRRRPLAAAATLVGLGMAILSQADALWPFIAGYTVFYCGLAAFLSIDTAMVAQLVTGHQRRGALLGVMNLTNTLPAIIAPVLTLIAFQTSALADLLGVLFLGCAVLALLAGAGVLLIRSVR